MKFIILRVPLFLYIITFLNCLPIQYTKRSVSILCLPTSTKLKLKEREAQITIKDETKQNREVKIPTEKKIVLLLSFCSLTLYLFHWDFGGLEEGTKNSQASKSFITMTMTRHKFFFWYKFTLLLYSRYIQIYFTFFTRHWHKV